jgi:hypothetical protein
MPSVSKKQHNLMAAVAHNPKFAKKVGIPQSVGKEFNKADKGKQFKRGGEMAESKKMVKKEVAFMKSKGAPKSMVKHEMGEAGMKKGGAKPGMGMFGTGARKAAAPAAKPAGDVGQKLKDAMQKKESAMAARKPGVYAGLTGKPAPAAKPAAKANPYGRLQSQIQNLQAKKSSAPAAKPAAEKPGMKMFGVGARKAAAPEDKAATATGARKSAEDAKQRMQSAMQKKDSAMAARKPATPAGETISPMDRTRTPKGADMSQFAPAPAPAMKKGGKVCGMKAGGVKKELPTAKDLGSMNMKKGGRVKCMAGGGYVRAADGVTKKGKTKGKII